MPEIVHRLLCSRGVLSQQEADAFLHPAQQPLHAPELFPGVRDAVAILRAAIGSGQRICVYGDYDVDGVSACAILSGTLEALGANVFARIPLRAEGYGLNESAVRELAEQGTELLVTVDCGIADRRNTDLAQKLGMQVIVTDHHRAAPETIPRCTVVSSQLGECAYPCPVLCGAGVAFKLACALDERFAQEYIDIAALATVADIVPLTGENRTIVALGLEKMNAGLRPGLLALLREADMEKRRVTEDTLGFQIGPRLNAGGRLSSAELSYRLLCARTMEEAEPLAKELNEQNNARRALERQVSTGAHAQLAQFDFTNRRAIALKSEDWNAGVIGIAASRLVEEYHYPVLLFAEHEGVLKGSCRSIEGVDIYLALRACEKHLTQYGGHTAAAGLTLDADKFDAFCADLDAYLRENIPPETWIPAYTYDADVRVGEADVETCRALDELRPFGMGNPAPVFLTEFIPAGVRRIGADGSHLKFIMTDEAEKRLDAVWFGHGDETEALEGGARRMAVGALQTNEFLNTVRAQFMVSQLLPENGDAAMERAKEGGVSQSFLTDILYTEKKQTDARLIDMDGAAALLAENLQGVVFAAASAQAAQGLYRALVSAGIRFAPDIVFDRWTQDERCFSAICLRPCGQAPCGVKHVVSLDVDPAFWAACVPGAELYRLGGAECAPCWLETLPDIDQLRRVYIAARQVASRPLHVKERESLYREIAMQADLAEHCTFAAMLVLQDMGLAVYKDDPVGLEIPRGMKKDPLQNRIFQNILALRERGSLL